jgi:nicotinamide mononucleotide transporter
MLEALFSQYERYPRHEVVMEIIAIVFGLMSVWFAKKDNIFVFPTGIISTSIYTYLLWRWSLLGDMMINAYYVIMSIVGWYFWSQKKGVQIKFPISRMTNKEKKQAIYLFVGTVIFVILVYNFFKYTITWISVIDIFVTGLFFVGMWIMTKRRIENWIFLIIGDIISIPMYFFKGYTFTSILYLLLTIIAVFGFMEWKRALKQENV